MHDVEQKCKYAEHATAACTCEPVGTSNFAADQGHQASDHQQGDQAICRLDY